MHLHGIGDVYIKGGTEGGKGRGRDAGGWEGGRRRQAEGLVESAHSNRPQPIECAVHGAALPSQGGDVICGVEQAFPHACLLETGVCGVYTTPSHQLTLAVPSTHETFDGRHVS